MPGTDPLLAVENLHVSVHSGGRMRDVVRGVSFQVARGEAIGLVGEFGLGQDTDRVGHRPPSSRHGPDHGRIGRIQRREPAHASARRLAEIRGKDISMVFQDLLASLNPIMRIGRQVGEPLLLHGMTDRRGAKVLAEEGLRRLGIPDPSQAMRRYPHEFSGGMRQRAMIATALIASPSLVIADEPTTALDATVQAQIIDLWSRLNREMGVALVLVSHDLGVVSEACDRLAVMYAGRIVEIGPTAVLLSRPRHPYTQALLKLMPSSATERQGRLRAIPGEPPAFGALPAGCPFHPRCPHVRDVCRSSEPSLVLVADTRVSCWVAQDEQAAQGRIAAAPEATGTKRPAPAAEPPSSSAEPPTEELLVLDRVTRHHLVPGLWPLSAPLRVHALDEVSLSVRRGETLGVAGELGCGKSTLARCVLRLIDVDQGRVLFRGKDITRTGGEGLRQLRRYMQPVFQDPYGSLNPRARVGDIVAEPLLAHGQSREASANRVADVLEFVGLGRSRLLSAGSAVGRAAAAGRDRAGDRRQSRADRRRRADLGARRFHPGSGAQPVQGPAAGIRPDSHLHQP